MTSEEAVAPATLIVKVSEPSVSSSLRRIAMIVAKPLELMTALPVNRPPEMSALFTPDRV